MATSCSAAALGLGTVLLCACGAGPRGLDTPISGTNSTSDDSGPAPAGPDSGSGDVPSDDGSPGSSATGEPDEVLYDIGAPFDAGSLPSQECKKVDFVFVVDNSESMAAEQDALVAAFPGFLAGIQSALDQLASVHVAVVTTDVYEGNAAACRTLGALVTQTQGAASSNASCGPFAQGGGYMTGSDPLAQTFPCAARVGIDGSFEERTIEALVAAVDGSLADPGGCNEGFIRDDALLVAVMLTDEGQAIDAENIHDLLNFDETLQQWHDDIVAAKHGHDENVVVISVVPLSGCEYETPDMIDFTALFGERGVTADLCSTSYASVFAQTIETIDLACEQFVPPG